jgi:type I restriction enzyme S subunit
MSQLVALGKLGKWVGGGTPSKSNPAFWTDGTIPWVSPKDMKTERILDAQDYITEQAVSNSAATRISRGSVLVVARSGILKHSLPVAVTDVDVTINQDLKAVELKPGFLPDYVAWAIRAHARAILHQCTKSGTTVQNLDFPSFLRFQVPIVSLDEQRCIVVEIEEQLSRLEAGVAALKRVQANLKSYASSVIASTFPRVGETLPSGWAWSSLGDLGELSRGKSKHRPRDDPKLYGGPYPFIQTGDVKASRGRIREFTQTYSGTGMAQSRLWPAGTLCITIAANIADTGILEFESCFPDSVVGFRADSGLALTQYIERYLRSMKEHLDRLAPATAQKNINLEVLSRVQVPVPPPSIAKSMVEEIDRRLSVVEELEDQVTADFVRAERLKQSILQQAFSTTLSSMSRN